MTIQIRSFHWEQDFELVRNFLIETFNQTRTLVNWLPHRFENRKYGPCGTEYLDEEDELVKIWEEVDDTTRFSKIVAVTVLEGGNRYVINIHPEYKFIEKDILNWIEEQVKEDGINSAPKGIVTYALGCDNVRIELLSRSGYKKIEVECYSRIRPLDLSIPNYQLPEGYTIRHVDIKADFSKYRAVQGAVFRHCGNMSEKQAVFYSTASFYVAELDLVVVAPTGEFAAFSTIRLDPVSKFVEFEPVGTHPDHRKKGLAKALIAEGLLRLKNYNPTLISIPGAANNPGANKLYESMGFTEKEELQVWKKELK